MIRVALLRGINVGGARKVPMARLRAAFERAGASAVTTYIASGNVVLADDRPTDELTAALEAAIVDEFGFDVRVLVKSGSEVHDLAAAIPADWVADKDMRADAWFLWPEIDEPGVVERLPIRDGIDEVRYVPGATLWRVAAADLGKSWRNRITGTELYPLITIRNVNTVRKLAMLVEAGAADEDSRGPALGGA